MPDRRDLRRRLRHRAAAEVRCRRRGGAGDARARTSTSASSCTPATTSRACGRSSARCASRPATWSPRSSATRTRASRTGRRPATCRGRRSTRRAGSGRTRRPGVMATEGENDGASVYAHEFSHILGVLDNYGNSFATPPQRDYSGPWDMMSRGSFNGPGGNHNRWQVPPTLGASMGSHHMLRNKLGMGFLKPTEVMFLDRNALAQTGPAVRRRLGARDPGRADRVAQRPARPLHLADRRRQRRRRARSSRTGAATAAATRTTRSRSSTGWARTRSRPTTAC